jgi:hypothetical protein
MEKLIDELYKEIILDESLFFRGIPLGSMISSVEKIEGTNFFKRTGNNPSYEYLKDIGEVERLELYYIFNLDTEKIYKVNLTFDTYPDFYFQEETGKGLSDFVQLMEQCNIEEYSTIHNTLFDKIFQLFTKLLSDHDEEESIDEIFNKKHNSFKRFIWHINNEKLHDKPLRLALTSYLDDKDLQNIKQKINIQLEETI